MKNYFLSILCLFLLLAGAHASDTITIINAGHGTVISYSVSGLWYQFNGTTGGRGNILQTTPNGGFTNAGGTGTITVENNTLYEPATCAAWVFQAATLTYSWKGTGGFTKSATVTQDALTYGLRAETCTSSIVAFPNSFTMTIYPGEASDPCYTNVTFQVHNNDIQDHDYFIADLLGNPMADPTSKYGNAIAPVTVQPGQTATISYNVPCAFAPQASIWQLGDSSKGIKNKLITSTPVLSAPLNGNTNAVFTTAMTNTGTYINTPAPNTYNVTNNGNPGNSSPIIFTADAATNAALAQQQGNAAIYDELSKFAVQNHKDLAAIVAPTNNQTSWLVAQSNLLSQIARNTSTNGGSGTGTNAGTGTNVNVMNWPSAWSNYLANVQSNTFGTFTNTASLASNLLQANDWLSGIYSNTVAGTNDSATGYSNAIMSALANGTNAAYAKSTAETLLSGPSAFFQSIVDGTDPNPTLSGDPGAGSEWVIVNFCGRGDINLDPVSYMPVAFSFARGVITWLLIAAYLFEVSRMYWMCIKGFAAMQTGGPPNLNFTVFGTGGNLMGVLVAVIMPAILVALWIACVTFSVPEIASMVGTLSGLAATTGVLSGAGTHGSMAWHVLVNAFPVFLFFHLILARITLEFTLAKSFFIATAASRWLFGK